MDSALLDIVPAAEIGNLHIGLRPAVRPLVRRRANAWVRQHVLGESLFKDALGRERKCADRFGSPFAVLLLNHGSGSADAGRWAPMLRAVDAVRRDIDLVGWLEQNAVLGMLLPDTSGKAALEVTRRVQREIDRRLGDRRPADLTISVYGHGDRSGPQSPDLRPADRLFRVLAKPRRRSARETAKRCLDILGSLALLALFAPLMLGIFAAVKLTSPGPALFRQVRVGRRGRPFTMLKFRTMYVNAGHGLHQDYVTWFIKSSGQQPRTGDEVYKLTNDPRITRVGHFLRKTSLDELPQFWNVLRGDMSLVGPRPPLPIEVEQYQAWHRRRVFDAKPGVTGPWQVNGRSRTTFDEMVRLDLGYARTYSLWTDIKILAATPRAMVSGKGAA